MPNKPITDRDRTDRAIRCADQLAADLRVLGYVVQAALIEDVSAALYSAKVDRAVRDLARR